MMSHLGVQKKKPCAESIHRAGCFCKMKRLCFLFGVFCDVFWLVHALLTRAGLSTALHSSQAFEPFDAGC